MRIFGAVMNGMVIVDEGRVALLSITRQTMADLGGTNDDLEGLINFPLTVKDIEAVAFFKEVGDHDWRVSLRSKGTVDIGAIARQFKRRRPHQCRRLLRARVSSTPFNKQFGRAARREAGSQRSEIRRSLTRDRQFPDGVLVVDKTEGPTSHDVVTLARRALGVSRIGHTGTLDPMATGVLPLVIGRATRLAQFLTASDKTYEATIAFGRTTDTLRCVRHDRDDVRSPPDARSARSRRSRQFRGTFEQTPPAFSAKNIDGERSYDLARRGKIDDRRRGPRPCPSP